MVEHIVHIDGVTGSSPVATTIKPRISSWVFNIAYLAVRFVRMKYCHKDIWGDMVK